MSRAGPPRIQALRRAAHPEVFERGEEYFADGRVGKMIVDADRRSAAATVRGSVDYRVRVRRERGAVLATRRCPFAADRAFCKHAVATGLAWLERSREGQASGCAPARDRGDDLWRELAQRRERGHPEDALAVYRSLLEALPPFSADISPLNSTEKRRRV